MQQRLVSIHYQQQSLLQYQELALHLQARLYHSLVQLHTSQSMIRISHLCLHLAQTSLLSL